MNVAAMRPAFSSVSIEKKMRRRRKAHVTMIAPAAWNDGIDTRPSRFPKSIVRNVPARSAEI